MMGKVVELEFHPLANLFPLMTGPAFDDLVADIQRNGQHEPILADRSGRIVDGRNRYRACLAADVSPWLETLEGEVTLELVLSLNLHRRHLDESQRAMVAARVAKMMKAEALKRRGRGQEKKANLPFIPFGESRGKAGAILNVSPRLITYAIKVLKNGCEELIAGVEAGQLAVSRAAALTALPKDQQAQAVAGGAHQAARKLRESQAGQTDPAGRFGVIGLNAEVRSAIAQCVGLDDVQFLWVTPSGLPTVVHALKRRGFRDAASEA